MRNEKAKVNEVESCLSFSSPAFKQRSSRDSHAGERRVSPTPIGFDEKVSSDLEIILGLWINVGCRRIHLGEARNQLGVHRHPFRAIHRYSSRLHTSLPP